MRDVKLFATKREYASFVRDEIFAEPLVTENAFYSRLIQFVIDAKAPLFYWQTDTSEHANFSVYYNAILVRDSYKNPVMRALYFLHDFAHAPFSYPHDLASVSQSEFDEAVIRGEYAASNETEILAHYRVKGLRERVFQDRRIFFDILRERGTPQPQARQLGVLRKLLVETDSLDPFFFASPKDEPVRAAYKSYAGNGAWCKHRLEETRALKNPTEYHYPILSPESYERAVTHYEETGGQREYEATVLKNVRLLFSLVGIERLPVSLGEALERAPVELAGKVLFQQASAK